MKKEYKDLVKEIEELKLLYNLTGKLKLEFCKI